MKNMKKCTEQQTIAVIKKYLYNCRILFVKMIQSPFSFEGNHIAISQKHFHLLESNEIVQLLKIHEALRALNLDEQIIIFHKYLGKATQLDFEIQNLLAVSERTYYRKKKRALIKLAIAMHFPSSAFSADFLMKSSHKGWSK